MRNVYIGRFADYKPSEESEYDSGMIGANIAIADELRKLAKTIGLEYYVKDKEKGNLMITDATAMEKLIARLKYIFTLNKKRVVGYRTNKMSDLKRAGYQLGRKFDEEKNDWVVDKEYYEDRGYENGVKKDEMTGETRVAEGYLEDKEEDREER